MATIVGNNANNILTGFNNVNDIIAGQGGNDTLFGLSGNDTLKGGTGTDTLNGGVGIDTADYRNVVLDPTGPAGPVLTIGATAGVTVNLNLTGFQNTGGAGFDRLVSIENITGSNFNDTLTGNALNNRLDGWTGNDILNGGAGNDTLLGWTGNDRLNGGTGNDQLFGEAGNDQLFGDSGNDLLNGGAGNDLLTGGTGKDTLTSGNALDRDTFDYNSTSESQAGVLNRDVITDFRGLGAAIGDRIDLSTIDANVFAAGNQAFTWKGSAAFSSFLGIYTPGQLRYSGGVIQGNTDFDAAPEFEIQLTGAPALFVQAGHAGSDILL